MNRIVSLLPAAFLAAALQVLPAPAAASTPGTAATAPTFAQLADGFAKPAPENRAWVYWFWNNGNITREGITADLEAMASTGIGGVLIMEVGQGAPRGRVDFMRKEWRELFRFAVTEAHRLGIEINMNNDAGWNGTGGFWIKPEHGMQNLTFSEITVAAGSAQTVKLPQPQTLLNHYRDITVLAFPTPAAATAKRKKPNYNHHRPLSDKNPIIAKNTIRDISAHMAADGTLNWTAPALPVIGATWTILRVGHTAKGKLVAPAPQSGAGLESDKLSVAATEAAFNGQMGLLLADNKDLSGIGKTLAATHIDSWENGSQTWTPKMRTEFRNRTNYDIIPYLPVFAGFQIDSPDITTRFLWDFRRALNRITLDNYVGTFVRLCRQHSIRLTAEAYDNSPMDSLEYAGRTDEPIGEFWCTGGWNKADGGRLRTDTRMMVSAGHIYGKNIISAEAFTAGDNDHVPERWLRHPGNIKALGDAAFAEGVNRFIFHRYSFQPWAANIRPGLMMGPWGIHYERTQTWWQLTPAWHEYLARCQYMLRQGRHIANIAYLEIEDPPQTNHGTDHPRNGYQWDQVNLHVLQTATVNTTGQIVLDSGAIYDVLVLPPKNLFTTEALETIASLAKSGATIIGGKPPTTIPGLAPDGTANTLPAEKISTLWNSGKILTDTTPEAVLANKGIKPVFTSTPRLNFNHRRTGTTEIFFVANPENHRVLAQATFDIPAGQDDFNFPELWHPETGQRIAAPAWSVKHNTTANRHTITVLLPLAPTESLFVVFTKNRPQKIHRPISIITRDDKQLFGPQTIAEPPAPSQLRIVRATYGPKNDNAAVRDATKTVASLLAKNPKGIHVSDVTKAIGDPAFGVLKTLTITYTLNGVPHTTTATDGNFATFITGDPAPVDDSGLELSFAGGIQASPYETLRLTKPGKYVLHNVGTLRTAKNTTTLDIPVKQPYAINGPWALDFPGKKTLTLEKLTSWTDSADADIKYYSGTATYTQTLTLPADFAKTGQRLILDLGTVNEFAEVLLDSKPLGVLWKQEKRLDITGAIVPGQPTKLEIRVTNLWPNRLIGDQFIPAVDEERLPNGTLKRWPQWLLDGKPVPGGRHTFSMWELWKKTHALVPSGLFGPVKIEAL